MRFSTIFIVALRALRRNSMRSILTALGIIIGVAAVITMVSIGNGAKAMVEAQVASLGQNLITVMPGSYSSGGMRSGFGFSPTLFPEDYDAIAADVEDIDGASPEVRDSQQVLANGLNWGTQVYGVSPDFPTIRSWRVAEGVFYMPGSSPNGHVPRLAACVVAPDLDASRLLAALREHRDPVFLPRPLLFGRCVTAQ